MSTLIVIGVGAASYMLAKHIPFFGEEGGITGTFLLVCFIIFLLLMGFIGYWLFSLMILPWAI